jgi:Anti-sigma regulatory factor (Ser/Thr protein kinase)
LSHCDNNLSDARSASPGPSIRRAFAATDITAPIEQRAIGGLGWHLVQQVMDEVRHSQGGTNGNRVTLVKRLSTTD